MFDKGGFVTSIRTRFAPSPTGYLHVGNLRTALYAFLIARHTKGTFILRIEDTDQEREVEGAIDIIYKTLETFGLYWDEGPKVGGDYGPYIQSERKTIYLKYANKLVETGKAYYCFCSKDHLDDCRKEAETAKRPYKYDKRCSHLTKAEIEAKLSSRESFIIRQNIPTEGHTSFDDILYGSIVVENSTLDDMILIKSDGFPTYNFANVIDDYLMGITHVVRGSEYLSSTPKYNLLYEAFGWKIPTYIHCPPVMKNSSQKLSKRHGDATVEDLLQQGYLSKTLLNYIALLGWNPGTEQELFSLEELIKAFDYHKIGVSPSIFDIQKLRWMNGEYLRKLSADEFHSKALPFLERAVKTNGIDLKKISKIINNRIEVLGEILEQLDFIDTLPNFSTSLFVNGKMKTDKSIALKCLQALFPVLSELNEWTFDNLHALIMSLIKEIGVKNGQMLWPMRIALSGKEFTPGGAFEIAEILGKNESIRRIKLGLDKLAKESTRSDVAKAAIIG